jgi:hypothetical protein
MLAKEIDSLMSSTYDVVVLNLSTRNNEMASAIDRQRHKAGREKEKKRETYETVLARQGDAISPRTVRVIVSTRADIVVGYSGIRTV